MRSFSGCMAQTAHENQRVESPRRSRARRLEKKLKETERQTEKRLRTDKQKDVGCKHAML